MAGKYYLYEWLDEYGISSVWKAKRLISKNRALDLLRERALQALPSLVSSEPGPNTLVAGRGLDLSGELGCPHPDCRINEAESLFRRAWHYFDRIVLDDHFALCAEDEETWNNRPFVRKLLLDDVKVLLHLRELDAEDLVCFRVKELPCEKHWKMHAEQVGFTDTAELVRDLAIKIASEAEILWVDLPRSGRIGYRLYHELLDRPQWGSIPIGNHADERRLRRKAAREQVIFYMSHLTADIATARQFQAPLGSTISFYRHVLQTPQHTSAADVAFHLELPVLEGISAKNLIALRKVEADHFNIFRSNLIKAIGERLRLEPHADAHTMAEEIRKEMIEPALAKIRTRLAASESSLKRKTAVSLFLGAVNTTCGLLVGGPVGTATIAAGLSAAGGFTANATFKHLDEQREVELDDMYFLWKLQKHRH